MPDDDQTSPQTGSEELPSESGAPAKKATARKSAAKKAPAKKAPAKKAAAKRTTAKKVAEVPADVAPDDAAVAETPEAPALPESPEATEATEAPQVPAAPTVTRTTRSRRASTKATAPAPAAEPVLEPVAEPVAEPEPVVEAEPEEPAAEDGAGTMPLFQVPEKTTRARRTRKTAAQRAAEAADVPEAAAADPATDPITETAEVAEEAPAAPVVKKTTRRRSTKKAAAAPPEPVDPEQVEAADEEIDPDATPLAVETPQSQAREADESSETGDESEDPDSSDSSEDSDEQSDGGGRRRRRRGGRRRRKSGDSDNTDSTDSTDTADDTGSADSSGSDAGTGDGADSTEGRDGSDAAEGDDAEPGGEGTSRRRRRRRRSGDAAEPAEESGGSGNGGGRGRRPRNAEDEITALQGSTRLEAKKQRRREGREAGRRRAPIVSEAEFLARRESVARTMVVRQRDDLTQIAVLEDKVLVEHYVARESQTSLIGNVYLGRVQNVLPSMEAAFIDIGKGRNAVLYAGEVNWAALGHKDGQPRKIESVLQSGQPILVQVTKDPIGHKGARLTSQVSLAGRFLVYVPDGTTSGISRKLPDTERNRLKTLLKEIVPETAGVIVRTAAEGASEEELTTDVERLKARWDDIEAKAGGNAPQLLYGEPDLTLKVVRDLFTEDFAKLVIQGDDAWDTVQAYVAHVAPDLEERLERYDAAEHTGQDVFATYRVEEQIAKGLDRKVWLPSGGSLVIDRTEAMTVVDVNTGKFTGSGGNLEETVTKNNLEAAEEMVRQLRLRDIGGIIVIDFIDMVLESNRDLVLRRLVECLGRDRTRHQVAEVTSLGLVQMTRKRIGTGLVEAFSESCTHCQGRGVVIQDHPVEPKSGVSGAEDEPRRTGRRRGGRGRQDDQDTGGTGNGSNSNGRPPLPPAAPSPAVVAAMARPENAVAPPADGLDADTDLDADIDADADTDADTLEDSGSAPVAQVGDLETTLESVRTVESSEQHPEPVDEQPEPTAPVEDTAPDTAPAAPVAPVAPVAPAAPEQPEQPEQPAQGAGFPDAPAEPEQPRVVTRSRRRSASRPAGPPPGALTPEPIVVTQPNPAALDGGADAGSGTELPVVEHVPVKRKGARKR